MKILILANSVSGLYSFRKELVEKLLEEHQVVLCMPEGDRSKYFKDLGCEFIKLDIERHGMNPLTELKLLIEYNSIVKSVKPDMVFTYTIKPNVYGGIVCGRLGIPYVANITGLGSAVENGGFKQKLTTFLYKQGLKKAKKVFFQNTVNRDFMVNRGMLSGPYDLLPGSGVNLNKFIVTDYPDGDTVDFLFIARVMKQKGIDQYLDAAKFIRFKYPYTRFHVCGDCEEDYKFLLQKLTDDGIIIYHGRVNDMPVMQKISSCTIHPTYYPEGMSNVLLESCASGRPIITTDRPGCKEIVDDGVNGYVINERDSADLIEKIEKFLQLTREERKQMGLAGRKKVEREFDRNIVVEKYLRELKVNEKGF